MSSDSSPSRSVVRTSGGARPATLDPELEVAAGYARAFRCWEAIQNAGR